VASGANNGLTAVRAAEAGLSEAVAAVAVKQAVALAAEASDYDGLGSARAKSVGLLAAEASDA
jgi:hypothetical protein